MIKKILSFFLKTVLSSFVNNFLKKKNFLIIFRNGAAIGDHVYMSSVLREISLQKSKKILLFSNYFNLFLNNPRIYKLFKIKRKSIIWFLLNNLKGNAILEFHSLKATRKSHFDEKKYFLYYHKNNKIHLARAMSEHFNLNLQYSDLKNEFFFSNDEVLNFKNKLNLPKNYALIQSTSKQSFTNNKEWKVSGMQAIVNFFNNINWIQIGQTGEPLLDNCKNYLDLDLRELAYVIDKCDFLITYEGLFNHLASCFNKKNFLIHTGFLPVEAFYYKNNILIEKNSGMGCYPCFELNCQTHNSSCQKNITEEFVIDKIRRNIQ